ncbi:MAG: DHHA1 domain-containing protein [Candidatus Bathyarchaeia archaeon]
MKTICIYHSKDLDGWMSAAIVKKWHLESQGGNVNNYPYIHEFHNIPDIQDAPNGLTMLGWDYGDEIPNLSDYDKIIMCDVSFPPSHMTKIREKLVWIDHHISAINSNKGVHGGYPKIKGLTNTLFAACELTWNYYFPHDGMPEIVKFLGMYDSYRHIETPQQQTVFEFQYGAREVIKDYQDAYKWLNDSIDYCAVLAHITDEDPVDVIWSNGRAIFSYLKSEASQVMERAFPVDLIQSDSINEVTSANFLCVNQPNFNYKNWGIEINDKYAGVASFHYEKGKWKFSLRSDKVDCSLIAKSFGGGGHKGAAGFTFDNLDYLIKN